MCIFIFSYLYIYSTCYICITNTCIVPLPPCLQAAKFLTGQRPSFLSTNSCPEEFLARSGTSVHGGGERVRSPRFFFSPRNWSPKKFRYLILELVFGWNHQLVFLTCWSSKWRCLVQDDITFSKRWSSSSMLVFWGWTFVRNSTWIPGRDIWKQYFLSTGVKLQGWKRSFLLEFSECSLC